MSIPEIPDIQSSLGERLKAERARLGLTQDALAERINVTGRSIAGYELGTTTIRQDIMYRLAKAGVDMPYVLFGDGQEGVAKVDPLLFKRVSRWADVACRDRHGNPLPAWERIQHVMRAYRWLASSSSLEELEERISNLPPARAA